VRYGLYLPNFGAFGDARVLCTLARQAEAAGWDGFFVWDHIARAWPTEVVDPWVALGAVAACTQRLRLGALVTPVARRRPWKLARETVSVDRLSGGRLVLGVGLGSSGGRVPEWESFGEEENLRRRARMLDEGLEILTGLWSGRPFAFEGRHYRVRETRFLPVPAQAPRIPVWVAGTWPHRAPLRRAARWDGVFPLFSVGPPEDVDALREVVRYVRVQRRDPEPFEVVYLSAPTPGADPQQAAARVAPYAAAGATWWLERMTPDAFGGRWQQSWPVEAMRERIAQGPPAG
jgi:alkanesulfonate monooxygenase SsuD/methylene tetrahydromethanopterin reductase-like flavin-dependent oxidoreductase (luciferase family)